MLSSWWSLMTYRGSLMTILVSSLAIVLTVQTRRVSGLYIEQTDKRSVADCQDHSLVADRCSAWKELDFCVNHQQEMQFVCNKTCDYCVPDQWAAKRIWGQIQVPDNAMDGPRFTETKNKTKTPFVQILGKEDLNAAATAIVNELQFHGNEQPRQKDRPNFRPFIPEIMGRVQSNNTSTELRAENQQRQSTQNETRSDVSLAEKMSRRIIDQLSSNHDIEAKSKPTDLQHDLSKLIQIAAASSKMPGENDTTLTNTAPSPTPSRSRFELNTKSTKIPLYLYENTEEKGRKNEKEKIKEASAAIRNVLKLFNQGKKNAFHTRLSTGSTTGVGMVEQLIHDIEASRTTAGQKLSEKALNRTKKLQLGNDLASDESGAWKKLARKLALQLQRVVRHMRLREFAQEHEKAALREQMIDMLRHEDGDEDDDEDENEAANTRRSLDIRGSRRKVMRDKTSTRSAAEDD